MIGKNHWHGRCRHLDDLLKDDIEFKIYFQGSHMKFQQMFINNLKMVRINKKPQPLPEHFDCTKWG